MTDKERAEHMAFEEAAKLAKAYREELRRAEAIEKVLFALIAIESAALIMAVIL